MKTRLPLLLAILPLLLLACSKNEAPAPVDPNPGVVTAANVSYTNYVKELIKTNCSGCHSGTGGAGQAWKFEDTYDNAKTHGVRLNDAVQSGRMPRGGRTMTQEQKDLLKAWITRNMPQ